MYHSSEAAAGIRSACVRARCPPACDSRPRTIASPLMMIRERATGRPWSRWTRRSRTCRRSTRLRSHGESLSTGRENPIGSTTLTLRSGERGHTAFRRVRGRPWAPFRGSTRLPRSRALPIPGLASDTPARGPTFPSRLERSPEARRSKPSPPRRSAPASRPGARAIRRSRPSASSGRRSA